MGWTLWYNNRSKLEKVLFCCVVVLSIVIIALFVSLLTSHDNGTCTSSECIQASAYIFDTVNQDADPCEDFYAFACGNFMKRALITGQPTTLHALEVVTSNQLKQIVVENRSDIGFPRTLVYQRKFYKACMNTEEIEKHGEERMYNIFDEVIGGWPIIKMNNWPEELFNWRKVMITARKLGLFHQYFFRIEVFRNYTNDESMLWIRPPSETDIHSFYFNESNVGIMSSIAKELGANSIDIKTDIRITINMVEQLINISERRNNLTLANEDDRRTNISINEINHKLIKFDWLFFLKDLTGIHLTNTERVVYDVDDYLTDIYYLFLRTPKKIIANYVAWILISTNINYLPKKIRDKFDDLHDSEGNKRGTKSKRSEECYQWSKRLFHMVAEAEYIRRYTIPEKKQEIQIMIDNVKAEMQESIKETSWIDDISRRNALRRLKNVTAFVGWMDMAFNLTKLEEVNGFNKVKQFPENGLAMDMAHAALKIRYDKIYAQIHMVTNELDSIISPKVEINAYYIRLYNILLLPAPLLQGELFNNYRPRYMNYGALGSIIGHELTHGFSLIYEKVDSEDDNASGLWTNATLEKRAEIVECIQNEYNSFRIAQGKDTNNETSNEENIADFNGVNLAYKAYQKWVRYNGQEPSLPGLKFAPEQVFWIMASTYMCYEPQLSDKDGGRSKDVYHGTPEFRIIGRIKHSPFFANDFNCPEGSKMNPKEKCQVFL